MKIVLDFDDTIFNTYKLTQEFMKVFQRAGFTEKEFYANYQATQEKTGDFDLETALDLFSELRFFNREKVKEEINRILSKANNFVYFDFFDFVKSFDKKDLILLSFGTTEFQKEKIEKSKVKGFFHKVIITHHDKIENFKIIYRDYPKDKIFFIDDKASQIDQVKKEFPQIITFKMERSQGRHIKTRSELTDYIVKDLDEVRACLTSSFRLKIPRFLP